MRASSRQRLDRFLGTERQGDRRHQLDEIDSSSFLGGRASGGQRDKLGCGPADFPAAASPQPGV
jgi:hypothetical protein